MLRLLDLTFISDRARKACKLRPSLKVDNKSF
jgi:hypothetical protein